MSSRPSSAVASVDAAVLKGWLHDGGEIALLDVREHGQFGESHLFYAVSLPYSRLEIDVRRLVPRLATRVVVHDEGGDAGDIASRAAAHLLALGYEAVHVLQGGIAAWRAAGFACFSGVNVPSKTFGELAEIAFHTPRIGARELADRVARGDDLIILDGRPLTEFSKMNIPGGICCPNGELALRAEALAPDPATTIVINCAGRTRSIIGAQTLINMGVPNTVLALENGTQGWFLEGLPLEHGASRRHSDEPDSARLTRQRANALALADRFGVRSIDAAQLGAWLGDSGRTTVLCDVRTAEEFARGTLPHAQHTPGGQLLQATDQYVGVRKARLVLFDGEMVRAPAIASWLVQMGWDASVLRVGPAALERMAPRPDDRVQASVPLTDPVVVAADLPTAIGMGARLIDVRASSKFRSGHLDGAVWAIRPRLGDAQVAAGDRVVLIADDAGVAALAARELRALVGTDLSVSVNLDGPTAWSRVGLRVLGTPDMPSDRDCIDYLFFVHDRHDGNRAAALQYLAWETNLVKQIDAMELAEFRFGSH